MSFSVEAPALLDSGRATLTCDVVVVGSGAGGATMAWELSRAGYDVIVLEAGPHVPSGDFTEQISRSLPALFQDHGAQTNADGDITILQGRCIGGSTTVNAAAAFPIPEWVTDRWREQHGVEGFDAPALEPLYARIRQHLAIHDNYPHEINRNSQLMLAGAERLGWAAGPLPRNVKQCALAGTCIQGCRYDRKQSMLVTYLPWAAENGARIISQAPVSRITTAGGVATGVIARACDADGVALGELEVAARCVVATAGTVQTPLLLMRSGLDLPATGRHLSIHPAYGLMASFDEPVHMWTGAQLGAYVSEFHHDDAGGFLIEGGGLEPAGIAHLVPGRREEHARRMAAADRLASAVVLVHDEGPGRVEPVRDATRARIDYRLGAVEKRRLRASLLATTRLWFAAGAREVYLPTVEPLAMDAGNYASVIASLSLEPNTLYLTAYHPQGTCRMGRDPQTSVVNDRGRHHGVGNLVIADASVFPTSVSVNTQVPVYVTAMRFAGEMVRSPERYGLG